MLIRDISTADLDRVLELNQGSVDLLSPLNEQKLRQLIGMAALSVVAEIDGRSAGFMLAFIEGADYHSPNYRWFEKNYARFLYIDRVVVADDFRGGGVGKRFYAHAIDWARAQAIPFMLAEIDIEPPNQPSLGFHRKAGFVEVERLRHGEHKTVSLQQLRLG